MLNKYLKSILKAQVYAVAKETPLDPMKFLSRRLNNQVLLKREDMQPVHSFKLRGAYNQMANLDEASLKAGVIAASAGNHAQGVAYAANKLGTSAVILMPKTTPDTKVIAVRGYGAEVILHGDTFDEACELAVQLAKEKGYTFVHPYDDPLVIAGQGTVGMEILRQHAGPIEAIFVPVGGGGLIGGVGAYVKYLRPEIKIIGVEADDSACLTAALEKNERVILDEVGLFADGVAVKQIGELTFELAKICVDEMVTVSCDEICASIKDIFDDTRSIAEPAGALAVAGMKKYVHQHGVEGATLVAINSGANTNFDRLRHISERTELGEHREAILAVTIPEKAGSFLEFCRALGQCSVTEFNYRFAESSDAHVFVGVKIASGDGRDELIKNLQSSGYSVLDMSGNEMAKLHLRHMVGGRVETQPRERIFRFEFPERPGALLNFLVKLGQRGNISLFHYRNHGAAFGRVLIGFQCAEGDDSLDEFMAGVGYRFKEESDNPAFKLFLS